jgi:XTP/dITP diphosphohydrolase
VAVVLPGREIGLFHGSVEGEIVPSERGEHGFGYDRLFWIPTAGKTMAELDLE